MAETDRPGYSFAPGPPPEASAFLRAKGLSPAFSWADVEPEEHATAFTVAKAMQADVLTDIRDEVQRALDEGRTFADFQRELRPRLQAKGWWGVTEMVDPATGEARSVQLGSPRRLRTIYRSNLRSARAAGQWDRIQRTKAALPYLLYQLGPSERHRPEHVAKNGLVLPADDPFWAQWYPPNGWGCKCWVRQITRSEAEGRGIGQAPRIEERPWQNPRTGEVRQVPRGLDPAWTGNPGLYRQRRMEDMLAGRMDTMPPEIARVIARDVASSWHAARVLEGAGEGAVPVAILPAALQSASGSTTRVVRMTSSYGNKLSAKGRDVGPETLMRLDEALNGGQIATETRDGRTSLHVFGGGWRYVLKILPDAGEIWISTMHRAEPRKWRALVRRAGVRVISD